jgi:chromosomal replication initiation ATPase DnaA
MKEEEEIEHRKALLRRLALLLRMEDICREHHVTIEGALSRKRTKAICVARDACFARMHELGLSHNEIGKAWGYDHSSVVAAVQRHKARHRDPKKKGEDVQPAATQQTSLRRGASQRKTRAV